MARVRMITLYQKAAENNALVVGTGDKSELLLGYFTKYGDGGVDILPLGDIYKTQLREFAKYLGIPEKIAYKPSSPELWPDHYAESELGLTYKEIDPILYLKYDLKLANEEVAETLGVDINIIERIEERCRINRHKLIPPPIIRIY
jgi:NAD+ synthase